MSLNLNKAAPGTRLVQPSRHHLRRGFERDATERDSQRAWQFQLFASSGHSAECREQPAFDGHVHPE